MALKLLTFRARVVQLIRRYRTGLDEETPGGVFGDWPDAVCAVIFEIHRAQFLSPPSRFRDASYLVKSVKLRSTEECMELEWILREMRRIPSIEVSRARLRLA